MKANNDSTRTPANINQPGARPAVVASLVAVMVFTSAGCSMTPDRPEQQLTRAETSIEFAEENGAREFGLAALDRARENLMLAQQKADDGEYDQALRLAEKAEIDAELAAAQSNTGKANEALQEILESIQTLRREIAHAYSIEGGQS